MAYTLYNWPDTSTWGANWNVPYRTVAKAVAPIIKKVRSTFVYAARRRARAEIPWPSWHPPSFAPRRVIVPHGHVSWVRAGTRRPL